jgi:hypothetical protein
MQDPKERIEQYERVQFRGVSLSELQPEKRTELISKRRRNRIIMMILNVLLMIFFGYSIYAGLTQLSQTWLTVIGIVFSVNIGLYLYQLHQLKEVQHFYERS